MFYNNLGNFIEVLEKEKEIIRINKTVDPRYEAGAIAFAYNKNDGPALLFENIIGSSVPMVVNLLSSRRRLALLFQCSEKELVEEYIKRSEESGYRTPLLASSAPCKEVIYRKDQVDLGRIPQIIWNVGDIGPYITMGVVRIKDCITGIGNNSVNRIKIVDKDKLAIYTTEERDLGKSIYHAWQSGKPAEIAITFGADPLYSLAAVESLKTGQDEMLLAGALRKHPMEVVKTENFDLDVPAYSEIVIEGIINQNALVEEGPFGECLGIMGKSTLAPLIDVITITQKRYPIYIGSYAGRPPVEASVMQDLLFEASLRKTLCRSGVEVKEIYFHPTSHGGHAIISISKRNEDDIRKLMRFVLPFPTVRRVTIVDDDIDAKNHNEVEWAVNTWLNPEKDIILKPNFKPVNIFSSISSEPDNVITKVVFNATRPTCRTKNEIITFPNEFLIR